MKKQLFLLAAIIAMASSTPAWAYDFSAVAPSGQTLYYNIVSGSAQVTSQNSSSYPRYSNLTGALTIPSSVTYNGTTYTVTSIGNDAFYYCSGLTSVTIPNSVTSIGNDAFNICSGLTSVTIPNSVTSIGSGAFYGCTGLTSTIYTGTIAQWCNISFWGSSANPLYCSHSLTISGSEVTNLVIPNGVTEIKQYAFCGCSGLTSVTIPNSVTSIGDVAFRGCTGLTSVTIGNSVTSIGIGAFYDCTGLTSVIIPNSVTSIGTQAFEGCSGLTSVTIPNSVTSIGSSAFSGCTSLTSVTIPNSVTWIGSSAFYNCTGLTSVIIPSSVTLIGNNAFYNVRHIEYHGSASGSPWGAISMNGITEGDFVFSDATKHNLVGYVGNGGNVIIPSNVETIGNKTFYGCTSLTSVAIGSGVTSIGSSAFYGCTGLTEIHSEASIAPLLGTDCFAGVPINIHVYIPCGSQMSYYYRWSYFSNFVEAAGFSFSATSADDAMGSVTVLTQPTCQSPTAVINAIAASGYQFQHWNNGVTDNPYSLVVTSDTALSAIFVASADTPCDTVYIYVHDTVYIHDTIYITGEGIDGADAMNAKVYTNRGQIVVEGAEGNMVTLYDVTGSVLVTKQDDYSLLRFDTPASGTYMIKIGAYPARKVVVIR